MVDATAFYYSWFLYDLIYLIHLILAYKSINNEQKNIFICISLLSFCLLAIFGNSITPDYVNYKELVEEISSTKDPFVHVEAFYIWLIHLIGNHFYIYNFCIFAPLFFCIYLIAKFAKLENPTLFLTVFVVTNLYSSIAGRFFLFLAVYTLSFTLLARKHFISAIFLLSILFLLHKMAYIALPLCLLYFFPLKLNWKSLLIGGCLFLFLVIMGRKILENGLNDVIELLDGVSGVNYLTKEEGANAGGSLWWQIIYHYQRCVGFLFTFIALYQLRHFLAYPVFSISRMMYAIVFWSSLTALVLYCIDLPDTTIADRTFSIGSIPLCYLFSQLPNYICIKRKHKIYFFLLSLFYLIFNNAYIVGVSHSILR